MKLIHRGYFLFFFILYSQFLLGQSSLHERVKSLEKRLQETQEEIEDIKRLIHLQEKYAEEILKDSTSKKEGYRWILDELQYKESPYDRLFKKAKLSFGGHMEGVYTYGQRSEDSFFEARRLTLDIKAYITDWITSDVSLEFFQTDNVNVESANISFLLSYFFNIKAGVIPVPFSRYNIFHDPPSQELTDPPLMAWRVVPTVWRETGISLFGELEPLPQLSLHYEVLISNGLGEGGFTEREGSRDARQGLTNDNNRDKQVTGRLDFIPQIGMDWLFVHIGLSGLIGNYDDDSKDLIYGCGIDGLLRIREFTLIGDHDQVEFAGEFASIKLERDRYLLERHPDTASGSNGFYIQALYRFFPESWRIPHFLNNETSFALIFRYDRVDLDESRDGGNSLYDDQEAYTIGFNFRPRKKTVMKIEYKWINEIRKVHEIDNDRLVLSFATYF